MARDPRIDALLAAHHDVVTTAQLRTAGITDREVAAAVANGELSRIQRGSYQRSGAELGSRGTALAYRASLTCGSALAAHGFWTPPRLSEPHLRLSRGRFQRLAKHPLAPVDGRFVWHVHEANEPVAAVGGLDAADAALLAADACFTRDELVATLESMLFAGVARTSLDALRDRAGPRLRAALARLPAEVKSESGVESLLRMALLAAGVRFEQQVRRGGRRFDFLIGDWLAVEVDGLEYHRDGAQFRRDRRNDRISHGEGCLVLRFTAWEILHRLDESVGEIVEFCRQRRHRRASAKRNAAKRVSQSA